MLLTLGRLAALPSLLSANQLPHLYRYLAKPGWVWTNVLADTLIAVSSTGIFACRFLFVGKVHNVPVASIRKRAEPELLKARALRSNMNHEIRTSMANEYN
jgi:hypothetical protein